MDSTDAALARRVGEAVDAIFAGDMTAGAVSAPVLGTPATVAAAPAAVATWKLAAAAVGGAASVVGAYVVGRNVGSW
ncbi:hypothetical protein [uncultured Microbacterium sp.]|uniref:hypothetical protein n=1 Tax=uncultured Microbacterium sp. TaxID=191216 RepID=UPI0028F083FC|nr:hypothetical protein [uncultured Microbacterium sp.]